MMNLDSPEWKRLKHAYGYASDIPPLLRQLQNLPSSEIGAEPWNSIWSRLAHQGDVYSASFAAVPHVIDALSKSPISADSAYFQFPAWVEVCRLKNGVEVPKPLSDSYFESLERLPSLVSSAGTRLKDPEFLVCGLAAMAASVGQVSIAEPGVVQRRMEVNSR